MATNIFHQSEEFVSALFSFPCALSAWQMKDLIHAHVLQVPCISFVLHISTALLGSLHTYLHSTEARRKCETHYITWNIYNNRVHGSERKHWRKKNVHIRTAKRQVECRQTQIDNKQKKIPERVCFEMAFFCSPFFMCKVRLQLCTLVQPSVSDLVRLLNRTLSSGQCYINSTWQWLLSKFSRQRWVNNGPAGEWPRFWWARKAYQKLLLPPF